MQLEMLQNILVHLKCYHLQLKYRQKQVYKYLMIGSKCNLKLLEKILNYMKIRHIEKIIICKFFSFQINLKINAYSL